MHGLSPTMFLEALNGHCCRSLDCCRSKTLKKGLGSHRWPTSLSDYKVTHHTIGDFVLAYSRHRPAVSGSPPTPVQLQFIPTWKRRKFAASEDIYC
jgi:hypothetical protein